MTVFVKRLKLSKETMYVGASFACLLVIIIITSITDSGLSLSKIFSKYNISNILINAAITVFGTFSSVPLGNVDTKQRVNDDGTPGRYLQEFNTYNKVRAMIEPIRHLFGQWHHTQYLNEFNKKRINYLLGFGVIQMDEILSLSREQIETLTEPQTYEVNGVPTEFKALSVEQVLACLKVYDGKISVHKMPDFYFLYIDGKGRRSFYDQAYYESIDENFTLFSKLIGKLFLGFVITCIFTGFIIDLSHMEVITLQYILAVVFMVVVRVFNAFTSIFWGYLIGQEIVYKQCYYINGKTQFLQSFYNECSVIQSADESCSSTKANPLENTLNE